MANITPEEILRGIIDNSLEYFDSNDVIRIAANIFYGHTTIRKVEAPSCTVLGLAASGIADQFCFRNCTKLQEFNLRAVEHLYGGSVFFGVGSSSYPTTIALPNVIGSVGSGFRSGYFDAIDLGPQVNHIGQNCFYSGTFRKLILRSTEIVAAGGGDAVSRLTTANGCTIYIPKTLYDHLNDGSEYDYFAATNWSRNTARTFVPIEGSEYEHYYADGTPIT